MVTSDRLVIKPKVLNSGYGEEISFGPKEVGWDDLGFRALKLRAGTTAHAETAYREIAIVVLGGTCSVKSSEGSWASIGRRENVFDGIAWTLYLSIDTDYLITAITDVEIAICFCPASRKFPARLISPREVRVETRGGGNATRQISNILMPEDAADRLMIVEVYTPSGNWSSCPPHKHDVHNPPTEVDLEEIYYYRIDRPEGYAIHRLYSYDGKRDECVTVHDRDLILVPDSYHTVVAAHGYNIYYLNALAGSARALTASQDPNFTWVAKNWTEKDPRVPFVREPQ